MQIDNTGVIPRDLSGYKELLESQFRAAFGEDLVLDGETPQGQFAGSLALMATEIEEAIVHFINGFSLSSSSGRQVDGLGSFLQNERIAGERSIVTVTFTGTAGTLIPALTEVRTGAGSVFVLDADVTIGAGGTVDGTMRSSAFGPIPASAGTLTAVVEVITGLASATNAAAAQLGRLVESDAEYRARYPLLLSRHGRGSSEHIRARVLAVEGVQDCRVEANSTASSVTKQAVDVPANSILIIVEGGASEDIADAIFSSKTGGIPTVGAVVVSVPHAQGQTESVRFQRVESVPLTLTIEITIGPDFANNGVETMRNRCVNWFNGEFMSLGGRFETAGVQIGLTVDQMRLLTPIQSVPGHVVTAYTLTVKSGGGALPTLPDLDQRYTIVPADITVNLS